MRVRIEEGLYLAGDVLSDRGLAKELEARTAADIKARFLSAAALKESFGLARPAALESDASASCNPAQLTSGLLRAARRRGLEIVAGVEVTDCRELGDQVVVALSTGELISARFVIFCTGYEFLSSLACKAHSITSTWAIATRPRARLPAWLRDYVVWEASDPYLYLRTSWDGRLIVGGEDEDDPDAYRSAAKLASKSALIREKVSDLLGCRVSKPAFTWAAAFGTTPTGLPYVDRAPGMNQTFAVMGFGGNGITFSQIASQIIAGAISGEPDPDADLFVFPD